MMEPDCHSKLCQRAGTRAQSSLIFINGLQFSVKSNSLLHILSQTLCLQDSQLFSLQQRNAQAEINPTPAGRYESLSSQRYFCSQLSFSFFFPIFKFPYYPSSGSFLYLVSSTKLLLQQDPLKLLFWLPHAHLPLTICLPSYAVPPHPFCCHHPSSSSATGFGVCSSAVYFNPCAPHNTPLHSKLHLHHPPLPTHESLVFCPFHPSYLLQTSINSKKLIAFTVSSHRFTRFSLCSWKVKVGIVCKLSCAAQQQRWACINAASK